MKREKRHIGNGLLSMIVLMIFIAGIATMLISGHSLSVDTATPSSTSGGTGSQATSTDTASVASIASNPNGFEEENTMPDDYSLISVLNDDVYKGPLVLVNYQYESHLDGENLVNIYDNISSTYTVKDDSMYINNAVMEPMNNFLDAFYEAKGATSIYISSSYRSKIDQQSVYAASVESTGEDSTAYYVAQPGYSEHQTGYCFDTATSSGELDGSGVYSWLLENCDDYGFILRYPDDKTNITGIGYESWHFRYVGLAHAHVIMDNGLCLEEYIEGIKSYTFDSGPLLVNDGVGGEWLVYYVPKLTAFNTTDVPVPKDCDYTISGNNIDGFIVTADVSRDSDNSLIEISTNVWSYDSSDLIIEDFEDYTGEDSSSEESENDEEDEDDSDYSDDEEDYSDYTDEDTASEFEYEDYYADDDDYYYDDEDEDYYAEDEY